MLSENSIFLSLLSIVIYDDYLHRNRVINKNFILLILIKTCLKRKPTLEIVDKYDKVNEFLNSISRRSIQTKKVYHFALSHFQTFLIDSEYKKYNIETILRELIGRDIDVYTLLNKFVGYLMARDTKLSFGSISLYLAGVRSYLEDNRIEISSKILKKTVKLPRKYERNEDEGAIDEKDIRTILLACTNTTLKAFLLVLACTGLRANEALCLRNRDIDFDVSPTKVHIRAETTKTGKARDVYISDECTKELKKFISNKSPNDLIFSKEGEAQTISIYKRLREHFTKLLQKVEMDKRKEGQGKRREITFHSFRKFVYTTLCSSEGGQAYAEGFIGHSGSVYHKMKPEKKRQMYVESMKYLTFLDFATVKAVGQDFESKLKEKDIEIYHLLNEFYQLEQAFEANKEEYNKFKMEVSDLLKKKQDSKSKKTD